METLSNVKHRGVTRAHRVGFDGDQALGEELRGTGSWEVGEIESSGRD